MPRMAPSVTLLDHRWAHGKEACHQLPAGSAGAADRHSLCRFTSATTSCPSRGPRSGGPWMRSPWRPPPCARCAPPGPAAWCPAPPAPPDSAPPARAPRSACSRRARRGSHSPAREDARGRHAADPAEMRGYAGHRAHPISGRAHSRLQSSQVEGRHSLPSRAEERCSTERFLLGPAQAGLCFAEVHTMVACLDSRSGACLDASNMSGAAR